MYALNEWDPCKKIIVGVADHARIPKMDESLQTVNYAGSDDAPEPGEYPTPVIEQANEDLETFCDFLKGEGVEVLRPVREHTDYYNYCPRDIVFAHKDVALATPMPLQARFNNYTSVQHHFDNLQTVDRVYNINNYNTECLNNPDVLALHEHEPLFDAANILRANDDLLYLVSNSGNRRGAEFLQEIVGSDTRVHLLENVYSYMHIDSTIAFLREGLMLCNPSRIKSVEQLPKAFRNWDIIWAPEPVDQGHYPGYCASSVWTWNVNLFSVSPELVVLEEHQHNLRQLLEQKGIDCAMLPIRHARTLGGCFHCVTLDTERQC